MRHAAASHCWVTLLADTAWPRTSSFTPSHKEMHALSTQMGASLSDVPTRQPQRPHTAPTPRPRALKTTPQRRLYFSTIQRAEHEAKQASSGPQNAPHCRPSWRLWRREGAPWRSHTPQAPRSSVRRVHGSGGAPFAKPASRPFPLSSEAGTLHCTMVGLSGPASPPLDTEPERARLAMVAAALPLRDSRAARQRHC